MRWAALTLLIVGCGSPNPERGGAGGAEVCTWCADDPPHLRICATTMIASGGQRVCVDEGEGRLCEAPSACAAPK